MGHSAAIVRIGGHRAAVVRTLERCAMFLLIVFCINELANAQPCRPIQIRNPEGNYIVSGARGDIPYSGPVALDMYVPAGPGRHPAVIVIHGGGWTSGSRAAHVGQLLELLTQAGYAWFSIDYRLGGLARIDDSLADVRAAIAFVRCHAREFRVDAAQLMLIGEDAGADLAGLAAAEHPPGVIGAVLIGGLYESASTPQRAQRAAHLVIHGGADSEAPVEKAKTYCAALVRAGTRCDLLEVTGASHRVENWWPNQWGYKRDVVHWLLALAPTRAATPARSGQLQKDVVYAEATQLKLDAFVARGRKLAPGVILVHGGGWEAGDKVTYITPLFEPLARAGFSWVSIDYRLTPAATHEEQLADLRQAIQFVRAEHARFNIDPARIVLVGESASGQMVSQIAAEDRSLSGVVSFYGVYDFPVMVTDASPRSLLVRLFRRTVLDDQSRALLRDYSPLYRAHKDMPPMLLVNGTADRLWPQARAFAERLKELGVDHEVIALDGAPHGMENWEGHNDWLVYKQRMVEWITQRVLR